jgi:hypothetical protein
MKNKKLPSNFGVLTEEKFEDMTSAFRAALLKQVYTFSPAECRLLTLYYNATASHDDVAVERLRAAYEAADGIHSTLHAQVFDFLYKDATRDCTSFEAL